MRARAIATITISADWTRAAVESIAETSRGVLAVIDFQGRRLMLAVTIANMREWVGIGQPAPTQRDEQERLVQRVVFEVLRPISELPETTIEISELVVG